MGHGVRETSLGGGTSKGLQEGVGALRGWAGRGPVSLLDAVWDLEEGSGAGPRDSSFLGALSRGGTRISCTFIKSSPGPTPSPALAAVWGAEREPPRTLGEVRGWAAGQQWVGRRWTSSVDGGACSVTA